MCTGVHKVNSHQQHSSLDPIEQWICRGNDAADASAAAVFHTYQGVTQLSDQVLHDIEHIKHVTHHTHEVMTKVGELAIQLQQTEESANREPDRAEQLQPPAAEWFFPTDLPEEAALFWQSSWPTLQQWNHSLHNGARIYHWSWYQLYADYVISTGDNGPWYDQLALRWKESASMPSPTNFVRRCRWFTTFWGKLSKKLGRPLPTRYQKPDCPLLGFWINTLPVRISEDRHQAVNMWLRQWNSAFQVSKDLMVIP